MVKNKNKYNLKKMIILKWLVLLFSWTFLTFLYIYSSSFLSTIIITNLRQDAFSVSNKTSENAVIEEDDSREFLKGEKLKGTFLANENFLGQVQVRFYNFNRINPDSVIFRIKENGQDEWFYESTHRTDQFQPNMFFTFGFPVIEDSINRRYLFEVESLDGQADHAIGLSSEKPLGATLYQYPKKNLLSSPEALSRFMVDNKIKKIEISLGTFVGIGIYINFIALSLMLLNIGFDYVSKKNLKKLFRYKSLLVMLIGLFTLILSAIVLYLNFNEFSFTLTTISYFILTFGVIIYIYKAKFRRKGK